MKIAALNYDRELVYIIHFELRQHNAYAIAVNPRTGKLYCSNIEYFEIIDENYRGE